MSNITQESLKRFGDIIDNQSKCGQKQNLDITVSVIFYVIQWVLLPPTLYVNILVLRMLKREKLSISLELKVESICNIVASVTSIINQGILKFSFPASLYLGAWYCEISAVFMSFGMFREMLQTLTLSVHRYFLIVHPEKTASDEEKAYVARTIFVVKWTMISLFVAKFLIFNQGEFVGFFMSICGGNINKAGTNDPLRETNTTTLEWVLKMGHCTTKNDSLVTNYGTAEGYLATVLQMFCFGVDIFINLTAFNMIEPFIYYQIEKSIRE